MQTLEHIRTAQKTRAALDSALVKHPRFSEALKKIEDAILFPTDNKLPWVVGPTGAGKTRLLQAVERVINKIVAQNMVADPGALPCISFDVPCPELGHRFSWSEHYSRYLEKLSAPLTPSNVVLAALPKTDSKRGLEHAVDNALNHRRPLAVLLDETNHFASVTSAKVLFDQTNRIKGFVSRNKVLHVCFGTYEVARMAAVSGQLARRSDIIHFSRYRAESEKDCADFRGIIRAFQKHLPVVHHLDLATKAKFLHERSIGCVGVLKGWLIKALSAAHGAGRSEISMDDLEATALPVRSLRIMLEDTLSGERSLEERPSQLDLFRQELGHAKASDISTVPADDLFAAKTPAPTQQSKAKKKPFELSPERLPTGGAFNGDLGQLAS